MVELVKELTPCGLFSFIGYGLWLGVKLIVTAMICKHPELSDEKVKYITRMVSINKH